MRVLLAFVALASCTRDAPHSKTTAAPIVSESTSVAPPAPPTGIAWGAPVSDLRLGLALEGVTAVVHLQNVGSAPIVIMSHIATHERQSDWLTVKLFDAKGGERLVAFDDDRDKSAPVSHTLAPGAEVVDRWDLAAWSARPRNGSRKLSSDDVAARAIYHVPPVAAATPSIGARAWSGTIESGRAAR